jgi:uncharacterized membrane protein YhaH (DUF805 family)
MAAVIISIPISLPLHIRRWHDLNQSGWLTLLGFVPLVGFIATIALLILPGKAEPNQYGLPYHGSLSAKDIYGLR